MKDVAPSQAVSDCTATLRAHDGRIDGLHRAAIAARFFAPRAPTCRYPLGGTDLSVSEKDRIATIAEIHYDVDLRWSVPLLYEGPHFRLQVIVEEGALSAICFLLLTMSVIRTFGVYCLIMIEASRKIVTGLLDRSKKIVRSG